MVKLSLTIHYYLMKKLIALLSVVAFLSSAVPSFAATSDDILLQNRLNQLTMATFNNPAVHLSVNHTMYVTENVMADNKLSHDQAIERIARALMSLAGLVPHPRADIWGVAAYDPHFNAFVNPLTGYYFAGVNPKSGTPQFTVEKRAEVGDNFWYCPSNQTYTYFTDHSECK